MKRSQNKLISMVLLCTSLVTGCATTNQPAATNPNSRPGLSEMGALFKDTFKELSNIIDEEFRQLRNGMSKQEVIEMLGNPDRVDHAEDVMGPTETLGYSKRLISGWSWARADYKVDLRESKVISFSKKLDVDTSYQASIGTVAIVSTNQTPILKFEGFAKGKDQGALAGAGGTFSSCMSGLAESGCSGSFCGAALILGLGICGTAALVGGAVGGEHALSESEATHHESVLNQATQVQEIQSALRDEVESEAKSNGVSIVSIPSGVATNASSSQDYRSLSPLGVDTVLETTFTHAGTAGAGINAPVTPYMQADVRLVKVHVNEQIFARNYGYLGKKLKFEQWAVDNGRPLQEEFEKGYRALGKEIYLDVFGLYPFPDRIVHFSGFLGTAFGLAPISPPTRGQLSGDKLIGDIFEWYEVDSVSPTLKWQAFPRPSDVEVSPEEMKRVQNVTYELVVAEEGAYAPKDIVYRQSGLLVPEHMVSTPLKPSQKYFWTIRAHFELDGRQRVTEWGSTIYPSRRLRITVPSRWSFRFRTPG